MDISKWLGMGTKKMKKREGWVVDGWREGIGLGRACGDCCFLSDLVHPSLGIVVLFVRFLIFLKYW